MNNNREIMRGEIYYLNCNEKANGNVQSGRRPVVIVQNEAGNMFSNTTIVVPLTTKEKRMTMPTHISIKKDKNNGLEQNSIALCEQILTINQNDLLNCLGCVTETTMEKIDKGLMISIGLAKKEQLR